MTATSRAVTASSMATRLGCVRVALAPGVSSRPALAAALMPSRRLEEDPPGLGEVLDALTGALVVGAVVGVGVAQEVAELLLDLAPGRLGGDVEAEHLLGPPLVVRQAAAP